MIFLERHYHIVPRVKPPLFYADFMTCADTYLRRDYHLDVLISAYYALPLIITTPQ